jgi:hypothetical protein
MLEKPAGLAEPDLIAALHDGWAIGPRTLEFLPAGFGGYHWRAGDVWLKVDDLGPPTAGC